MALPRNNYVDLYEQDEFPFTMSEDELIKEAIKYGLMKSPDDIDNLYLGHFRGYKAIKVFLKCKIMRQIPGPCKTPQSITHLTTKLEEGFYDGELLDSVLLNWEKRSFADIMGIHNFIKNNYPRYLNPNKKNTLPRWDESKIQELSDEEKKMYSFLLMSKRNAIFTRKEIADLCENSIEDFDKSKIDTIIKFFVDNIIYSDRLDKNIS